MYYIWLTTPHLHLLSQGFPSYVFPSVKEKCLEMPGLTGQTPVPFMSPGFHVCCPHGFSAWQALVLWDSAKTSPLFKITKRQAHWPLSCPTNKPSPFPLLAPEDVSSSAWKLRCLRLSYGWLLLTWTSAQTPLPQRNHPWLPDFPICYSVLFSSWWFCACRIVLHVCFMLYALEGRSRRELT